MASKAIFQLILHEHHYKETMFIFHIFKDLNTINVNKLNTFEEFVLEDGRKCM
jgi:hypothetical protein